MTQAYRVLYIEDNVDNRILVQRFLSFEGFDVFLAETGQEGLDQVDTLLPDLFLIDLNLPDMSGYEVVNRLLERETTRTTPKVIFSAGGVQQVKENIPQGEPIFFMRKPVDIDKLVDKLIFALQCPDNTKRFIL
ncbi:response regulator [Anaerolineales bacterium HSG6]|nr:response regulator [Anaerolineales bacterium HSG6]MDM8532994.1 response regulator [Anaerolineales bacterium HSG25]